MIETLHCHEDPKLHGNSGIFLIMGNAGFIPSTVVRVHEELHRVLPNPIGLGLRVQHA